MFITDDDKEDSSTSNAILDRNEEETFIGLKKHTTKLVPQPYSKCLEKLGTIDDYAASLMYWKTVENSKPPNEPYKYRNCFLMCMQSHFSRKCGCEFTSIRQRFKLSSAACYSKKANDDCILPTYFAISQNETAIKECDCPLECNSTWYLTSVTSSKVRPDILEYFAKKWSSANHTVRHFYPDPSNISWT